MRVDVAGMTRIDKSVYLREACDNAARVWVLTGAKPGTFYTYIGGKWAEVSIRFDGEANPPRRRVEDREAVLKRLEDLTSDRSHDA